MTVSTGVRGVVMGCFVFAAGCCTFGVFSGSWRGDWALVGWSAVPLVLVGPAWVFVKDAMGGGWPW